MDSRFGSFRKHVVDLSTGAKISALIIFYSEVTVIFLPEKFARFADISLAIIDQISVNTFELGTFIIIVLLIVLTVLAQLRLKVIDLIVSAAPMITKTSLFIPHLVLILANTPIRLSVEILLLPALPLPQPTTRIIEKYIIITNTAIAFEGDHAPEGILISARIDIARHQENHHDD